jgi:hypothetical protein
MEVVFDHDSSRCVVVAVDDVVVIGGLGDTNAGGSGTGDSVIYEALLMRRSSGGVPYGDKSVDNRDESGADTRNDDFGGNGNEGRDESSRRCAAVGDNDSGGESSSLCAAVLRVFRLFAQRMHVDAANDETAAFEWAAAAAVKKDVAAQKRAEKKRKREAAAAEAALLLQSEWSCK